MAYDDGFYYGQCKLICKAVTNMNGKTVTATAVDGSSAATSAIIEGGKCVLTVPGRALYKVEVSEGAAKLFTKEVECGYGDCIVVYLADGYDVVKQSDLLSLDSIESDANIEYKGASAQAVKDVVTDKLGGCIISEENGEFFIQGFDSQKKKLGSLTPIFLGFQASHATEGRGGANVLFDVNEFTKFKYSGTNLSLCRGIKDPAEEDDWQTAVSNTTKWNTVEKGTTKDTWIDISQYRFLAINIVTSSSISSLCKDFEWSKSTV